jgi:hypothetical protein
MCCAAKTGPPNESPSPGRVPRGDVGDHEFSTLDFDSGCSVVRRRTVKVQPDTVLKLPNTLDWAYFAEHRRALLNLTPASTEELRNLFIRAGH